MRQLILILCLVLASGVAQAQKAYKVIQPDGTVLFTDSPPSDEPAQQVEILPLNTAPPLVQPSAYTKPAAAAPEVAYSEFRITSPADGETIRDNAGNVNISVSVTPGLKSGHRLGILMDGQKLGSGRATSITLAKVNRGSHSVQAVIKDSVGKEVERSNSVTFNLLRRTTRLPSPKPALF